MRAAFIGILLTMAGALVACGKNDPVITEPGPDLREQIIQESEVREEPPAAPPPPVQVTVPAPAPVINVTVAVSAPDISVAVAVSKPKEPSLESIRRAAEGGDAESQIALAALYYQGKGVLQDHAKSAEWMRRAMEGLRRAAERGDAEAQYRLGCMHRLGGCFVFKEQNAFPNAFSGISTNLDDYFSLVDGILQPHENAMEAMKWFRLAAEQGHAKAQYELGGIYGARAAGCRLCREYGVCRKGPFDIAACTDDEAELKNNRESYIWNSLAAANGHKWAAESRDKVAEFLSPAQLSAAQAEAARRRAKIQGGMGN